MRKTVVTLVAIFFATSLIISLSSFKSNDGISTLNNLEVFSEFDADASIAAGKAIYEGKGTCAVCHQVTGLGLPPTFPPLAKADYLLADKQRAIKQTMYGSKEPITVNGTTYPGGIMTVVPLTDEEVRDVVNYILNSWGNDAGFVTLEEVKAARE